MRCVLQKKAENVHTAHTLVGVIKKKKNSPRSISACSSITPCQKHTITQPEKNAHTEFSQANVIDFNNHIDANTPHAPLVVEGGQLEPVPAVNIFILGGVRTEEEAGIEGSPRDLNNAPAQSSPHLPPLVPSA